MKLKNLSYGILILFLVQCGGEWVAADSETKACDVSDVPFSTAQKISLSSDGESLYILDRFSHVYAYNRNNARTCAFELARTPDNPDGQIPADMAEQIEKVGTFLYYYDGISVLRYEDENFSCDISLRAMALTPSYIYAAPSAGLEQRKITVNGCNRTGTSFAAARVLALDVNDDWIATVETSGALTDAPQRFVIYDERGNVKTHTALAASDTSNSLYFCSATKVRFGATFVALLDAKCNYLGVFSLDGELLHRLKLSDIDVRNPVDIDVIRDGLYILTTSSIHPLYYLDLASFAFGEE